MKINKELSLKLNTKKHNPLTLIGSGYIALASITLFGSIFMVISMVIWINRAETPDETAGLLNNANIQKAADLIREETLQFTIE